MIELRSSLQIFIFPSPIILNYSIISSTFSFTLEKNNCILLFPPHNYLDGVDRHQCKQGKRVLIQS